VEDESVFGACRLVELSRTFDELSELSRVEPLGRLKVQ